MESPAKVRATNEQSISWEALERIAEWARCIVELAERTRRETGPRSLEHSARPIEFLTENEFAILRPWEANASPAPDRGSFELRVRGPDGDEGEVTVRIADRLIEETWLQTRGRIERSSSFWICCAEKHLAAYLADHDRLPDDRKLVVHRLDPEEVMLAKRWASEIPARVRF